jgi:hypothetical protein
MSVDSPTTPDNGRSTWSPARRAAQDAGKGLRIPIVLPGRGPVGFAELPADLTPNEWEIVMQLMNAYRYAMAGPGQ